MVILALNQNNLFAQATGKVMIVSSTNIVIYTSSILITYPMLGIYWGTIASFFISVFWILLMHPIVVKMR